MKKIGTAARYTYFMLLASLLFINTASAYIDPTTSALLIQIVAGVFITLGVVFGLLRHKIIMFFKGLKVKSLQKQIEKSDKEQ
ncbi:MAG: hypothetical protein FWF94_04215 [Oscillospiraceae bacterium]|nr:hypothetical protein [Oscillospiraceae bacterium]